MLSIKPILSVSGINMANANSVRKEEPEEWSHPIRAKTVMTVEGSTSMCTTFLVNQYGRDYYVYSRTAYF